MSQKILFADVSANPLESMAVGVIFDGQYDVTTILFDSTNRVTDDEFIEVASRAISRGLKGASIGEYINLEMIAWHRDVVTHPSSTNCEIATFSVAQAMSPDIVVGDSVAVEKLAYIDGLRFVRFPGHGKSTPYALMVADRLSRKILRGLMKHLFKK